MSTETVAGTPEPTPARPCPWCLRTDCIDRFLHGQQLRDSLRLDFPKLVKAIEAIDAGHALADELGLPRVSVAR